MSKEYIERGALLELETFLQDADGFDCSAVLSVDIRAAKAADVVEVKHGRWKREYDSILNKFYWSCSECKEWAYSEGNYCPNCGAKMEGE